MNAEIIEEVSHGIQFGKMSFLEAVGKLIAAGVEYYHVDYVRLRKTCYGQAEREQKGTKPTEASSFSNPKKSSLSSLAPVENFSCQHKGVSPHGQIFSFLASGGIIIL